MSNVGSYNRILHCRYGHNYEIFAWVEPFLILSLLLGLEPVHRPTKSIAVTIPLVRNCHICTQTSWIESYAAVYFKLWHKYNLKWKWKRWRLTKMDWFYDLPYTQTLPWIWQFSITFLIYKFNLHILYSAVTFFTWDIFVALIKVLKKFKRHYLWYGLFCKICDLKMQSNWTVPNW